MIVITILVFIDVVDTYIFAAIAIERKSAGVAPLASHRTHQRRKRADHRPFQLPHPLVLADRI